MEENNLKERRDRYAALMFEAVVDAYMKIRQLPRLTAINYERESGGSRRLTSDAIDYLADVERLTERALTHSDPTSKRTPVRLVRTRNEATV